MQMFIKCNNTTACLYAVPVETPAVLWECFRLGSNNSIISAKLLPNLNPINFLSLFVESPLLFGELRDSDEAVWIQCCLSSRRQIPVWSQINWSVSFITVCFLPEIRLKLLWVLWPQANWARERRTIWRAFAGNREGKSDGCTVSWRRWKCSTRWFMALLLWINA